jgi:hypothetical protein
VTPWCYEVCPKANEVGTSCRGSLVWGKRQNVTGWFCRGGGEALYACLADDSPDLDAVGFIPGKPWCMAQGAPPHHRHVYETPESPGRNEPARINLSRCRVRLSVDRQ